LFLKSLYDIIHVMSEKVWNKNTKEEDALFYAVNYMYRYKCNSTKKQLKKWTLDYVKETFGAKAVKDYQNGKKYDYEVVGSACKTTAVGCPVDVLKDKIDKGLAQIKSDTLATRERSVESAKNLKNKPKIDPKVKFNQQLGEYIFKISSEIDKLVDFPKIKKKDWFNAEQWFKSQNIKPEFAVEILNNINPTLNELKEALEGECEQLNEAYSFLKRRYHTRLVEFISEIVEVAKRYSNKRVVTKSGKKKKKKSTTPAMMVRKLPYMKKFDELGLTSIDPKEVIGSSILYVYNTISRLICVYVANDTRGLSIKGASITGYNEKKSFTKKLRSPKHSTFMVSTGQVKKYVSEHVKAVKTIEKPIRPRLNKNCIILKVF